MVLTLTALALSPRVMMMFSPVLSTMPTQVPTTDLAASLRLVVLRVFLVLCFASLPYTCSQNSTSGLFHLRPLSLSQKVPPPLPGRRFGLGSAADSLRVLILRAGLSAGDRLRYVRGDGGQQAAGAILP